MSVVIAVTTFDPGQGGLGQMLDQLKIGQVRAYMAFGVTLLNGDFAQLHGDTVVASLTGKRIGRNALLRHVTPGVKRKTATKVKEVQIDVPAFSIEIACSSVILIAPFCVRVQDDGVALLSADIKKARVMPLADNVRVTEAGDIHALFATKRGGHKNIWAQLLPDKDFSGSQPKFKRPEFA